MYKLYLITCSICLHHTYPIYMFTYCLLTIYIYIIIYTKNVGDECRIKAYIYINL